MSVDVEGFSRQDARRWWHLDARVVAHLRSGTGARREPWAVAPAAGRRNEDSATAFAPTQWPDTEWADTRSDLAP